MSRSLHTCNREVNALINQQKTQSQSRRSRLPGCCSISNRLVAWLMRWPSGWKNWPVSQVWRLAPFPTGT